MPAGDEKSDHAQERLPLVPLGQQPAKEATSWSRVVLVFVVSAAWMIVSSGLIVLNKYIMVDLGFEYPMFVTGMGMGMSGMLAFISCRVLRIVEARETIDARFWFQRVLPIGLLMAITLWTGNEVYLHLTVAFIQMLKAFNPVITMVCLMLASLEYPTREMVASVVLTAMGTAAAAYGEVRMSVYGVVLMFCSETTESIRLVMTQFLLVGLNVHPIEGLMYLSSTCCLWLLLGCLVVEVPHIRARGDMDIVWHHLEAFMCASMMGFAVNALAYVVIKFASSLTLKVLATAKNTLLVVCGVLFFGEAVTGLQGYGYLVSLTGFVWYNWLKMHQLAAVQQVPRSGGGGAGSGGSLLGPPNGGAGGSGGGSGGGSAKSNDDDFGKALGEIVEANGVVTQTHGSHVVERRPTGQHKV